MSYENLQTELNDLLQFAKTWQNSDYGYDVKHDTSLMMYWLLPYIWLGAVIMVASRTFSKSQISEISKPQSVCGTDANNGFASECIPFGHDRELTGKGYTPKRYCPEFQRPNAVTFGYRSPPPLKDSIRRVQRSRLTCRKRPPLQRDEPNREALAQGSTPVSQIRDEHILAADVHGKTNKDGYFYGTSLQDESTPGALIRVTPIRKTALKYARKSSESSQGNSFTRFYDEEDSFLRGTRIRRISKLVSPKERDSRKIGTFESERITGVPIRGGCDNCPARLSSKLGFGGNTYSRKSFDLGKGITTDAKVGRFENGNSFLPNCSNIGRRHCWDESKSMSTHKDRVLTSRMPAFSQTFALSSRFNSGKVIYLLKSPSKLYNSVTVPRCHECMGILLSNQENQVESSPTDESFVCSCGCEDDTTTQSKNGDSGSSCSGEYADFVYSSAERTDQKGEMCQAQNSRQQKDLSYGQYKRRLSFSNCGSLNRSTAKHVTHCLPSPEKILCRSEQELLGISKTRPNLLKRPYDCNFLKPVNDKKRSYYTRLHREYKCPTANASQRVSYGGHSWASDSIDGERSQVSIFPLKNVSRRIMNKKRITVDIARLVNVPQNQKLYAFKGGSGDNKFAKKTPLKSKTSSQLFWVNRFWIAPSPENACKERTRGLSPEYRKPPTPVHHLSQVKEETNKQYSANYCPNITQWTSPQLLVAQSDGVYSLADNFGKKNNKRKVPKESAFPCGGDTTSNFGQNMVMQQTVSTIDRIKRFQIQRKTLRDRKLSVSKQTSQTKKKKDVLPRRSGRIVTSAPYGNPASNLQVTSSWSNSYLSVAQSSPKGKSLLSSPIQLSGEKKNSPKCTDEQGKRDSKSNCIDKAQKTHKSCLEKCRLESEINKCIGLVGTAQLLNSGRSVQSITPNTFDNTIDVANSTQWDVNTSEFYKHHLGITDAEMCSLKSVSDLNSVTKSSTDTKYKTNKNSPKCRESKENVYCKIRTPKLHNVKVALGAKQQTWIKRAAPVHERHSLSFQNDGKQNADNQAYAFSLKRYTLKEHDTKKRKDSDNQPTYTSKHLVGKVSSNFLKFCKETNAIRKHLQSNFKDNCHYQTDEKHHIKLNQNATQPELVSNSYRFRGFVKTFDELRMYLTEAEKSSNEAQDKTKKQTVSLCHMKRQCKPTLQKNTLVTKSTTFLERSSDEGNPSQSYCDQTYCIPVNENHLDSTMKIDKKYHVLRRRCKSIKRRGNSQSQPDGSQKISATSQNVSCLPVTVGSRGKLVQPEDSADPHKNGIGSGVGEIQMGRNSNLATTSAETFKSGNEKNTGSVKQEQEVGMNDRTGSKEPYVNIFKGVTGDFMEHKQRQTNLTPESSLCEKTKKISLANSTLEIVERYVDDVCTKGDQGNMTYALKGTNHENYDEDHQITAMKEKDNNNMKGDYMHYKQNQTNVHDEMTHYKMKIPRPKKENIKETNPFFPEPFYVNSGQNMLNENREVDNCDHNIVKRAIHNIEGIAAKSKIENIADITEDLFSTYKRATDNFEDLPKRPGNLTDIIEYISGKSGRTSDDIYGDVLGSGKKKGKTKHLIVDAIEEIRGDNGGTIARVGGCHEYTSFLHYNDKINTDSLRMNLEHARIDYKKYSRIWKIRDCENNSRETDDEKMSLSMKEKVTIVFEIEANEKSGETMLIEFDTKERIAETRKFEMDTDIELHATRKRENTINIASKTEEFHQAITDNERESEEETKEIVMKTEKINGDMIFDAMSNRAFNDEINVDDSFIEMTFLVKNKEVKHGYAINAVVDRKEECETMNPESVTKDHLVIVQEGIYKLREHVPSYEYRNDQSMVHVIRQMDRHKCMEHITLTWEDVQIEKANGKILDVIETTNQLIAVNEEQAPHDGQPLVFSILNEKKYVRLMVRERFKEKAKESIRDIGLAQTHGTNVMIGTPKIDTKRKNDTGGEMQQTRGHSASDGFGISDVVREGPVKDRKKRTIRIEGNDLKRMHNHEEEASDKRIVKTEYNQIRDHAKLLKDEEEWCPNLETNAIENYAIHRDDLFRDSHEDVKIMNITNVDDGTMEHKPRLDPLLDTKHEQKIRSLESLLDATVKHETALEAILGDILEYETRWDTALGSMIEYETTMDPASLHHKGLDSTLEDMSENETRFDVGRFYLKNYIRKEDLMGGPTTNIVNELILKRVLDGNVEKNSNLDSLLVAIIKCHIRLETAMGVIQKSNTASSLISSTALEHHYIRPNPKSDNKAVGKDILGDMSHAIQRLYLEVNHLININHEEGIYYDIVDKCGEVNSNVLNSKVNNISEDIMRDKYRKHIDKIGNAEHNGTVNKNNSISPKHGSGSDSAFSTKTEIRFNSVTSATIEVGTYKGEHEVKKVIGIRNKCEERKDNKVSILPEVILNTIIRANNEQTLNTTIIVDQEVERGNEIKDIRKRRDTKTNTGTTRQEVLGKLNGVNSPKLEEGMNENLLGVKTKTVIRSSQGSDGITRKAKIEHEDRKHTDNIFEMKLDEIMGNERMVGHVPEESARCVYDVINKEEGISEHANTTEQETNQIIGNSYVQVHEENERIVKVEDAVDKQRLKCMQSAERTEETSMRGVYYDTINSQIEIMGHLRHAEQKQEERVFCNIYYDLSEQMEIMDHTKTDEPEDKDKMTFFKALQREQEGAIGHAKSAEEEQEERLRHACDIVNVQNDRMGHVKNGGLELKNRINSEQDQDVGMCAVEFSEQQQEQIKGYVYCLKKKNEEIEGNVKSDHCDQMETLSHLKVAQYDKGKRMGHLENIRPGQIERIGPVKCTGTDHKERTGHVKNIDTCQKERTDIVKCIVEDQKERIGHEKFTGMDQNERTCHVKTTEKDQKERKDHVKNIEKDQKEIMGQMKKTEKDQKERTGHMKKTEKDQKERMDHVKITEKDQKESTDHMKNTEKDQKERMGHAKITRTYQNERIESVLCTGTDQKKRTCHVTNNETHQKERMAHVMNTEKNQKERTDHVKNREKDQKERTDHVKKTEKYQKEKTDHVKITEKEQKEKREHVKFTEKDKKERTDHVKITIIDQKERTDHVKNTENDQKEKTGHVKNTENDQKEKTGHVKNTEKDKQERMAHVTDTETYQKERSDHVKNTETETDQKERTYHLTNIETYQKERPDYIKNTETVTDQKERMHNVNSIETDQKERLDHLKSTEMDQKKKMCHTNSTDLNPKERICHAKGIQKAQGEGKGHVQGVQHDQRKKMVTVNGVQHDQRKKMVTVNGVQHDQRNKMVTVNGVQHDQTNRLSNIKDVIRNQTEIADHVNGGHHYQETINVKGGKHDQMDGMGCTWGVQRGLIEGIGHVKDVHHDQEERMDIVKCNIQHKQEERIGHLKGVQRETEETISHVKIAIHDQEETIDHVKHFQPDRVGTMDRISKAAQRQKIEKMRDSDIKIAQHEQDGRMDCVNIYQHEQHKSKGQVKNCGEELTICHEDSAEKNQDEFMGLVKTAPHKHGERIGLVKSVKQYQEAIMGNVNIIQQDQEKGMGHDVKSIRLDQIERTGQVHSYELEQVKILNYAAHSEESEQKVKESGYVEDEQQMDKTTGAKRGGCKSEPHVICRKQEYERVSYVIKTKQMYEERTGHLISVRQDGEKRTGNVVRKESEESCYVTKNKSKYNESSNVINAKQECNGCLTRWVKSKMDQEGRMNSITNAKHDYEERGDRNIMVESKKECDEKKGLMVKSKNENEKSGGHNMIEVKQEYEKRSSAIKSNEGRTQIVPEDWFIQVISNGNIAASKKTNRELNEGGINVRQTHEKNVHTDQSNKEENGASTTNSMTFRQYRKRKVNYVMSAQHKHEGKQERPLRPRREENIINDIQRIPLCEKVKTTNMVESHIREQDKIVLDVLRSSLHENDEEMYNVANVKDKNNVIIGFRGIPTVKQEERKGISISSNSNCDKMGKINIVDISKDNIIDVVGSCKWDTSVNPKEEGKRNDTVALTKIKLENKINVSRSKSPRPDNNKRIETMISAMREHDKDIGILRSFRPKQDKGLRIVRNSKLAQDIMTNIIQSVTHDKDRRVDIEESVKQKQNKNISMGSFKQDGHEIDLEVIYQINNILDSVLGVHRETITDSALVSEVNHECLNDEYEFINATHCRKDGGLRKLRKEPTDIHSAMNEFELDKRDNMEVMREFMKENENTLTFNGETKTILNSAHVTRKTNGDKIVAQGEHEEIMNTLFEERFKHLLPYGGNFPMKNTNFYLFTINRGWLLITLPTLEKDNFKKMHHIITVSRVRRPWKSLSCFGICRNLLPANCIQTLFNTCDGDKDCVHLFSLKRPLGKDGPQKKSKSMDTNFGNADKWLVNDVKKNVQNDDNTFETRANQSATNSTLQRNCYVEHPLNAVDKSNMGEDFLSTLDHYPNAHQSLSKPNAENVGMLCFDPIRDLTDYSLHIDNEEAVTVDRNTPPSITKVLEIRDDYGNRRKHIIYRRKVFPHQSFEQKHDTLQCCEHRETYYEYKKLEHLADSQTFKISTCPRKRYVLEFAAPSNAVEISTAVNSLVDGDSTTITEPCPTVIAEAISLKARSMGETMSYDDIETSLAMENTDIVSTSINECCTENDLNAKGSKGHSSSQFISQHHMKSVCKNDCVPGSQSQHHDIFAKTVSLCSDEKQKRFYHHETIVNVCKSNSLSRIQFDSNIFESAFFKDNIGTSQNRIDRAFDNGNLKIDIHLINNIVSDKRRIRSKLLTIYIKDKECCNSPQFSVRTVHKNDGIDSSQPNHIIGALPHVNDVSSNSKHISDTTRTNSQKPINMYSNCSRLNIPKHQTNNAVSHVGTLKSLESYMNAVYNGNTFDTQCNSKNHTVKTMCKRNFPSCSKHSRHGDKNTTQQLKDRMFVDEKKSMFNSHHAEPDGDDDLSVKQDRSHHVQNNIHSAHHPDMKKFTMNTSRQPRIPKLYQNQSKSQSNDLEWQPNGDDLETLLLFQITNETRAQKPRSLTNVVVRDFFNLLRANKDPTLQQSTPRRNDTNFSYHCGKLPHRRRNHLKEFKGSEIQRDRLRLGEYEKYLRHEDDSASNMTKNCTSYKSLSGGSECHERVSGQLGKIQMTFNDKKDSTPPVVLPFLSPSIRKSKSLSLFTSNNLGLGITDRRVIRTGTSSYCNIKLNDYVKRVRSNYNNLECVTHSVPPEKPDNSKQASRPTKEIVKGYDIHLVSLSGDSNSIDISPTWVHVEQGALTTDLPGFDNKDNLISDSNTELSRFETFSVNSSDITLSWADSSQSEDDEAVMGSTVDNNDNNGTVLDWHSWKAPSRVAIIGSNGNDTNKIISPPNAHVKHRRHKQSLFICNPWKDEEQVTDFTSFHASDNLYHYLLWDE